MKKLFLAALLAFLAVFCVLLAGQAADTSLLGRAGEAAALSAMVGNLKGGTAAPAESMSDDTVGLVADTEEETGGAATSSDTAAAAADPGEALGKITSKFISPYTAGLSFGNIYIKNSTSKSVDIETELQSPVGFQMTFSAEPEVLIMHTHATESYMLEERDYYSASDAARSTDDAVNMNRIGEKVAEILRANGISVVHDMTQHDAESYTGSYDRSAATVSANLKKYPSIKVVLDLHRDSVGSEAEKVKAVQKIGDKNAAQIMLVMGCEDGSITNHPNWRQNLRLAMRFQQAAELKYPGLARSIMLVPRCYNQNLTSGSMLIEIGTEANTLAEAEYSAELVGDILSRVLKGLQ
ncbi:MAG: stage II sporulation protein P [Candidatus Howiella sp.]|jgi:stage II sporulation protein P